MKRNIGRIEAVKTGIRKLLQFGSSAERVAGIKWGSQNSRSPNMSKIWITLNARNRKLFNE